MSQMTAVQVSGPGSAFETVNRQVPEPRPHTVRIKIQACGVCHSDVFVKEGHWPGLLYPRVTGHEVAGVIDAVGPGVTVWKKGQRVGVGWHGGHCGECPSCRRGDFMGCQNFQVTGFKEDGGYAQYMIARSEAVAAIPDALSPIEAAPILCAGVTTFNSLRHSGAKSGDLVAVQGLGGLGHLGIQFASQLGYCTVAIGRGQDKEALALKLGAARLSRHRHDQRSKRIDQDGWRLGYSGNRAEQQIDVSVDRRTRCRWQVAGCGGISRPHCCHAHSTYRRPPVDSRLAIRNRPGFGRHTQLSVR